MATSETRRQLLAAVAACEDKKGEDTRILSLDPADSGLADFFLITSASNDRQVVAIADEIEMRLKKEFGVYPTSVEGRRQAEWILLDYVDIVIHVFLAEKRAFYDIERLRKSARSLTPAELEAEFRSVLAQKTRAVRDSAHAQAPLAKPKGDATVTVKPAKKAAKKAAAKKAPAKVAAKPAVKAAVKPAAKSAAKLALKSATKSAKPAAKSATGPVMGMTAPIIADPTERGAKPPILKCEDPDMSVVAPDLGAKPPVVKCEDPDQPAAIAASAATPVKAAKTAAKKAVAKKAAAKAVKSPAKAPLKQAVAKRKRG